MSMRQSLLSWTALTLVVGTLGFVGLRYASQWREQQAIAKIKKLGGQADAFSVNL